MEEIKPEPETFSSPTSSSGPEQSLLKKPVGYVVALVAVVVAILFIFGRFGSVQKPAEESSAVVREQKLKTIVERVKVADKLPLSDKEKSDMASFLSDPAIQSVQMTREEQEKIVEAFNNKKHAQ